VLLNSFGSSSADGAGSWDSFFPVVLPKVEEVLHQGQLTSGQGLDILWQRGRRRNTFTFQPQLQVSLLYLSPGIQGCFY